MHGDTGNAVLWCCDKKKVSVFPRNLYAVLDLNFIMKCNAVRRVQKVSHLGLGFLNACYVYHILATWQFGRGNLGKTKSIVLDCDLRKMLHCFFPFYQM
jgi:hypothetical protein